MLSLAEILGRLQLALTDIVPSLFDEGGIALAGFVVKEDPLHKDVAGDDREEQEDDHDPASLDSQVP